MRASALVSDVELVDDYPSSVLSHARRQHRWVRGDWQILFWLFPFVPSRRGLVRNTLPLIGRWKILDNLRRSLVAPTLLAMLVAGWLVLPGRPSVWTLAAIGVVASQLLPVVATLLIGPRRSQSIPVFLGNLRRDSTTTLAQMAFTLTFLAFHAFAAVHAIALTLVRCRFHQTAHARMGDGRQHSRPRGRSGRSQGVRRFSAEMIASPITAVAVTGAIINWRSAALATAAPFLLLWLLAPVIAYRLSVPVGERVRPLGDRRAHVAAADRAQDVALFRNIRDRSRRVAAA